MKTYRYCDEPLELHGLPFYAKNGLLERLPADVREAVPTLRFLGKRIPGARLCFRTNSPEITVKIEFETLSVDNGMALYSAQSANVMIGPRQSARFAGFLCPANYDTKTFEKTFKKSRETEDVTIWLPRNEVIADITVSVADDAVVLAPRPYTYPPMLYYGSSITEGGCCTRVTNGYNAIISRHLDVDYYNFGFSGNARGERAMAELISGIPMSIFVLDYDHNAYDIDLLRNTHEPFFKTVRQASPDLPIIIMTRPDFENDSQSSLRRDIIRATYENAVKAGDTKVWFIDGETFFGKEDRALCTVDCTHPNDLGFYRMATVIEPIVANILKERYPEKERS